MVGLLFEGEAEMYRKLTRAQRDLLEKSLYVLSATESQINYTSEFKLETIKLFHEGLSPMEIFKRFDLDFDFFSEDYRRNSIKTWRKLFKEKGKSGFLKSTRGRKHKVSVDHLSTRDLKALVRVQMGVIEDLKKKKALVKKK